MKYSILLLCLISIGISSCTNNPYIKDVDTIEVKLTINSFEKDIKNLSENYSEQKRNEVSTKYGSFFESFNARIMKLGMSTDTGYSKRLYEVLHEEWMMELYKESDKFFKNTDDLHKKIQHAFQYYVYYFPNKKIPQIATFIGGVQFSVVIDSNMIAIGIDKYLGPKYRMYNDMEISSFIKKNMYVQKIPADVMRAVVENEFPNNFTEEYLLSQMIQQGRYMYFVKCMLPEEPDTLLWGYTARQLEFCNKSEGEFWKYFVGTDNILFSSDYMMAKRFIDDGPFTPIFTRDSPGKIGQWIGFKIVESFMKQNPDVDLQELFAIESAQEIMKKAKYNP